MNTQDIYSSYFHEADALSVRAKEAGKYDVWFAARALAENYKSLCWKYMMKSLTAQRVESGLIELREKYGSVFSQLFHRVSFPSFFSAPMGDVYAKKHEERVAFYRKERIDDQLRWYESKQEQAAVHKETTMVLSDALKTLSSPIEEGEFITLVEKVETHFLSKHTFLMP